MFEITFFYDDAVNWMDRNKNPSGVISMCVICNGHISNEDTTECVLYINGEGG